MLSLGCFFFFFNDTATTEIYTLSLHDALPISSHPSSSVLRPVRWTCLRLQRTGRKQVRSEEHTSELQSHLNLVCRLLLEKKKLNSLFHTRPPLTLPSPLLSLRAQHPSTTYLFL